jgi:DNA-binding response OmpR family regulator
MSTKIPIPNGKTKTAKVLVVDDEPEITEVIEAFLESSGYQVLTENSPVVVVERVKEYQPDIILLDIMMTGMDGYQICEELKREEDTRNIPVLFLTGKDSRDDSGRSFKVGGDMFIKKPFSGERLLEIINIVLVSIGKR